MGKITGLLSLFLQSLRWSEALLHSDHGWKPSLTGCNVPSAGFGRDAIVCIDPQARFGRAEPRYADFPRFPALVRAVAARVAQFLTWTVKRGG